MSGATILGRMADRSSMLEVPALAKELGERFVDAGHELYLVGGSVRDMVQGRPSPDLDFATSAPPAETTRLLRGWADRKYLVGVAFGTVGALKDGERLEITTYRKEVYAEEHRKPSVTFGDDILVDLSRRDFTINAMAVRLPDGDFTDPYGGLKALTAKLLDTPLDPETSFSDDPLRMIRAARFVARLDLRPADRVVESMHALADRLAIVSAERIRDELDKLLVGEHAPAGLALLVDTGLADRFLPELPALSLEQDPVHRHKDVLRHTYAVVDRCEPDLVLRLAALLHDVGKPATRKITPEGVTFHHHEVEGARIAADAADRASVPEVRDRRRLHADRAAPPVPRVRRQRVVRRRGPPVRPRRGAAARQAEPAHPRRRHDAQREARRGRSPSCRTSSRSGSRALAEQENLEAMRPPLDGRQVMDVLGLEPGPEIGEALAYLMELRLERGPIPQDEAIELVRAWAAGR